MEWLNNPHYLLLAELYSRSGEGSLREDVRCYLEGGFVFSSENYFLFGKPVDSAAKATDILSARVFFPWNRIDAWFVAGFSGDMKTALSDGVLPFFLPKIGFCRAFNDRLGLRFYDMERWLVRIQAMQTKSEGE